MLPQGAGSLPSREFGGASDPLSRNSGQSGRAGISAGPPCTCAAVGQATLGFGRCCGAPADRAFREAGAEAHVGATSGGEARPGQDPEHGLGSSGDRPGRPPGRRPGSATRPRQSAKDRALHRPARPTRSAVISPVGAAFNLTPIAAAAVGCRTSDRTAAAGLGGRVVLCVCELG